MLENGYNHVDFIFDLMNWCEGRIPDKAKADQLPTERKGNS